MVEVTPFRKGKTALSILITGSLQKHTTIQIDRASLSSELPDVFTTIADDVPIGIFYDSTAEPDSKYFYKFFIVGKDKKDKDKDGKDKDSKDKDDKDKDGKDDKNEPIEVASLVSETLPSNAVLVLVQTKKPADDTMINSIVSYTRIQMAVLGISGDIYRADINEVSPTQYEDTKLGEHCLMIVDDALNTGEYQLLQVHSAIDSIMSEIATAKVVMLSQLKSAPYKPANFEGADASLTKLVSSVIS